MIDLPRRADETPQDHTPFLHELTYFLRAQGLDSVIKGISKFDFSNTKHLAFVHSIPGEHYGDTMQTTGYLGLNKAVRELGLQTDSSSLNIDYASASLGALDDGFLQKFLQAASGGSMEATKSSENLEEQFRIYFPTHQTVAKSIGGTNGGGTISLQPKFYNASKFPKALMRDHQSTRKGMLSHSKLIFARGRSAKKSEESRQPIAWAYVGSANLSGSAWGTAVQGRGKEPKLVCRNWECGVVISVLGPSRHPDLDQLEAQDAKGGISEMGVFDGVVDVPFQVPAEGYGGARTPWFFRG